MDRVVDPAPTGWRLPFVGRDTALDTLSSAVAAAEFGEPVLALVAGEPGIGKSRLMAEVVARSGAEPLWAGCWEGDGAPAYWLWLQLGRALDATLDDPTGRTIPALLEGGTRAPEGRFQLFDAVTEILTRASTRRPMVLVLEDLHWADEASVHLLEFLARDRRPRRLAILGTYRHTDLDPDHPLARAAGDLVRDGVHLTLSGLARSDVSRLISAMDPGRSDLTAQATALHRKSGGNPFFLRELVGALLIDPDAGLVDPARGRHTADVPTGVESLVQRRLARLDPETRQALEVAAVAGRPVDPGLLAAACDTSSTAALRALQEAMRAGLVVETEEGFAFAHALVREVLYAAAEPDERAARHRRIAEVLEERRGEAWVTEVAHHTMAGALGEATPAERIVGVAVRAAEHSMRVLAYEDAAAWYGHALDALGPDRSEREVALRLRHGEAYLAAGALPLARDAYQRAAAIARAHGDAEALAQAALGLGAGFGGFEVTLLDPLQVELLEEALDALPEAASRLRAWVLARLSVALAFMGDEERRLTLSAQAVSMARELGDPAVLGYALAGHCDAIAGPDHCETRLAEATEVVALAEVARDPQLEMLGRRLRFLALHELGEVGQADVEVERFAWVAEALRQPLYRWYVPLWRGMRALMRGDMEEATRWCAEAEEIGEQAHSENARLCTFTQWWVRQRQQGRFIEAGTAMAALLRPPDGDPTTTPAGWPYDAIVSIQLGETERARAHLEQWVAGGLGRRVRDSEWLPESAQLAQAAVLADCRSAAELLHDQLLPYAEMFCVEGIGAAGTGSVSWYLAVLAEYLGRPDEAAAHAARARAAHRRAGMLVDPPALAAPTRPAPPESSAAADLEASLVCNGATWTVTFAGINASLRDGKGLRDIAVLVARPAQEVHCLELVGGMDVGSAPGPVIDDQARQAYQRRIRELTAEIEEARQAADLVRAEKAEHEYDALMQQLSEAFGLSGRARPIGSAAERARSAVGWRIRSALRQVTAVHEPLGRHLQQAIHTGVWCSYRPEPAIRWSVRTAQERNA